jgi:hypothetical protein
VKLRAQSFTAVASREAREAAARFRPPEQSDLCAGDELLGMQIDLFLRSLSETLAPPRLFQTNPCESGTLRRESDPSNTACRESPIESCVRATHRRVNDQAVPAAREPMESRMRK